MALSDFYFTLICDSEFVDAGRAVTAIGRQIKRYLTSREYGEGVNEVAIGIVMREIGVTKQRKMMPKYNNKRRKTLLGHALENTLEFSVYPRIDSVRSAALVGDLIDALRAALKSEVDAVCSLSIPDFDTPKFIEDLDGQLRITRNSHLWGSAEISQFSRPQDLTIGRAWQTHAGRTDLDVIASHHGHQVNENEFPLAVLAFVERELPSLRRAIDLKDRTALGPLIARLNKFSEPWADLMTEGKAVVEVFEDCGHLLVDFVRELAIELDRTLTQAERQRLHLEFQKRLDGCRACAEKMVNFHNKID